MQKNAPLNIYLKKYRDPNFQTPQKSCCPLLFFYNYICHRKFKSSYTLLIFTNMIDCIRKLLSISRFLL